MSQLTELIDKTIHDIKFNGCTLPESIIRMQFDNIVACAKLEESRERNAAYLESFKLDSAHGNGANDRPNVIGDCITEPEQVGRWYKCVDSSYGRAGIQAFTKDKWYFCPTNDLSIDFPFIDNFESPNSMSDISKFFDLTNPQLNNPDLDYVNPITN